MVPKDLRLLNSALKKTNYKSFVHNINIDVDDVDEKEVQNVYNTLNGNSAENFKH